MMRVKTRKKKDIQEGIENISPLEDSNRIGFQIEKGKKTLKNDRRKEESQTENGSRT